MKKKLKTDKGGLQACNWATLPHLWLSENSEQSVTENISSGINSLNQYNLEHNILIIICLTGSLNNWKYKRSCRYYCNFFCPPTSVDFWQKKKPSSSCCVQIDLYLQ